MGTFNLNTAANTASSKTLADFKREIGRVAGAQDNPDDVGAQFAVELALSKIFETNWDFYLTKQQITLSAGTDDYSLTSGVKDIALVRCTSGYERKLRQVKYEEYSAIVQNQSGSSTPMFYSLHKFGAETKMTFIPGPGAEELIDVWYFREPEFPARNSDVVDIPRFLERPLILLARVEVASNTTTVPTTRLGLLMSQAEDALRGAQMRDRNPHDQDVGFRPGSDEHFPSYPWDHPNRSE